MCAVSIGAETDALPNIPYCCLQRARREHGSEEEKKVSNRRNEYKESVRR